MAEKKPGHSIADHQYGADLAHSHDGDDAYDHDHDHDHDHDGDFGDEGSPESNPLWVQDHVSLTSVGIDIGSSGTQLIFSRLHLRRLGEDLSSRYCVVSRETLHQSPVALTPYRDEALIDDAKLADIIDEAYASAGLHPDQIDSGVVILTGEALPRRVTTSRRCSRPTAPARHGSRTPRASASSTSTSAAARPSSPSWKAAASR